MFTFKPLPWAALFSGGLLSASIQAATFIVTTAEDQHDRTCDSHCSLRDAVTAANKHAGADHIILPAGIFELTLQNPPDDVEDFPAEEDRNRRGDLDVRDALTISGAGMLQTVIQGAVNDRLIEVRRGAQLTLEGLTLQGGDSVQNGGAVENHGVLALQDVLVQNNRVTPWEPAGWEPGDRFHDGRGGAIANYGRLTVVRSLFKANITLGLSFDYHSGRGGAIYNSGGLLVQDSLFQANSAADGYYGDGGGAAIYSTGQARIERSTILDHSAGHFNDGGAIANDGGTLVLLDSTLSGNTLSLTNGYFDEVPERSRALLGNVTITGSSSCKGLGCSGTLLNGGELQIRNSIVAGNSRTDYFGTRYPSNCSNIGRYYRYQSVGLLINDEPSNCTGDFYIPFEATHTQVLSEQMQLENERVGVHPLLPGSPALDVAVGDCATQDQRGTARPQDGDGDGVAVCDLGAYELTP